MSEGDERLGVKSYAPDCSVMNPLVLREKSTVRLVFEATVTINQQDRTMPVTGRLVYQKKKKNDEWEFETHTKLNTIKAGSGVQLQLSTWELFQVTLAVRGLYGYFRKHGVPKKGVSVPLREYAAEVKHEDIAESVIADLIRSHGAESVRHVVGWASDTEDLSKLGEVLGTIPPEQLQNFESLAGLGTLWQASRYWEDHKEDSDEKNWQRFFKENPVVLSRLFSCPVMMIGDEAYMGGKRIDYKGGKVTDFLYQNPVSSRVMIVEVKTPKTKLLRDRSYRSGVYAPTDDLSGCVVQAASQRSELLKDANKHQGDSEGRIKITEPRCVVLLGNSESLNSEEHQERLDRWESFELFRASLRQVEVVTFDELFKSLDDLIGLIEDQNGIYGNPPF